MAITKKNIAIQEQKAAYRGDAKILLDEIKGASQKVPQEVIQGDAVLAAKWRDTAENLWRMEDAMPRSLTSVAMADRLAWLKDRLGFLRSPSA